MHEAVVRFSSLWGEIWGADTCKGEARAAAAFSRADSTRFCHYPRGVYMRGRGTLDAQCL